MRNAQHSRLCRATLLVSVEPQSLSWGSVACWTWLHLVPEAMPREKERETEEESKERQANEIKREHKHANDTRREKGQTHFLRSFLVLQLDLQNN